MELIYILLVLLIITRIFGELAERFGQPALLGELVSGILLGMVVHSHTDWFPILSELEDNEVFGALTELGIFFLLLMGGFELRPKDLAEASSKAFIVAFMGMLVPFACGFGLAWLVFPESQLKFAQALFMGTALSVTAVPVAIKVLMDFNQLKSRFGKMIVSAAVIDDVLSLILLAALTAFLETGELIGVAQTGMILLKVCIFFAICMVLGLYVFPAIGKFLEENSADEFEFSMVLVAALGYSLLAELLGMHFILGAFLAGIFFGRQTINPEIYEQIQLKIKGITTGFLAPIFFASIGLNLDVAALKNILWFVLVLILIATLGKVLGAGVSARLVGLDTHESLAVGFSMNARGAVELIVADIAYRAGLFNMPGAPHPIIENLFSAVVIMAIVTTVVTPPLLKLTISR